jgi:UDP-glucose 4-epimerase
MNVLLTGGTGYIGSHTAVVLMEAGFNIVLLDNLSNSKQDVVDRLKKITSKKIAFVEGDVRDKSLVSSVLSTQKIDAVIHFAGLKSVSESVLDPLRYFDNNVGGTISLLEAMQDNDVKTIVFSSSATVYGEPQYLPIDELHPTCAINPYGRTKLHIEEMLQDLCSSDTSWRVICLRYFNPVGAHESGLIGENPVGLPNNLMPYLLDVACGVLPELLVFGDDYETVDGTGVRDYIHVMDLSLGHKAALEFCMRNSGFEVFNLGTGIGFSVLEVLTEFQNISGKKIPYQVTSRRQGDVALSYSLSSKAKAFLGWEAKRSLADMCATSLIFAQKHLKK